MAGLGNGMMESKNRQNFILQKKKYLVWGHGNASLGPRVSQNKGQRIGKYVIQFYLFLIKILCVFKMVYNIL